MHWLHALDVGLLRFVNETLSNPVFDVLMPMASGQGTKGLFLAIAALAGVVLAWKGGRRGRVCVVILVLIVASCDGLLCNTVKHAVARPRPYTVLPDVKRPGSRSQATNSMPTTAPTATTLRPASAGNNSMPSSHAANWFAATMVLYVYYRRSWTFALPAALLVSFSRIYNGVHYPSDVCAGALLGAGYAVASLWVLQALWQSIGRRWLPHARQNMPSLLDPDLQVPRSALESRKTEPDAGAAAPIR